MPLDFQEIVLDGTPEAFQGAIDRYAYWLSKIFLPEPFENSVKTATINATRLSYNIAEHLQMMWYQRQTDILAAYRLNDQMMALWDDWRDAKNLNADNASDFETLFFYALIMQFGHTFWISLNGGQEIMTELERYGL